MKNSTPCVLFSYMQIKSIYFIGDFMDEKIIERIIQEATYMIINKTTVRETSKVFGVSKSTIHFDVSNKLKEIDTELFEQVKALLEYNKSIRHIRGGISTKEKYRLQHRD